MEVKDGQLKVGWNNLCSGCRCSGSQCYLPNEGGPVAERLRGSQSPGLKVAPEAACTPECGDPALCRHASACA